MFKSRVKRLVIGYITMVAGIAVVVASVRLSQPPRFSDTACTLISLTGTLSGAALSLGLGRKLLTDPAPSD